MTLLSTEARPAYRFQDRGEAASRDSIFGPLHPSASWPSITRTSADTLRLPIINYHVYRRRVLGSVFDEPRSR
jgi:hypothetical protein